MAEPSGGFVGRLEVAPEHGPVGTPLTVTGEGFPPEQEFDLVWRTVKGQLEGHRSPNITAANSCRPPTGSRR